MIVKIYDSHTSISNFYSSDLPREYVFNNKHIISGDLSNLLANRCYNSRSDKSNLKHAIALNSLIKDILRMEDDSDISSFSIELVLEKIDEPKLIKDIIDILKIKSDKELEIRIEG